MDPSHGIQLSHKNRWSTAICENTDGSWEYQGKQNKSDRKSQEPYDLIHVWDIKLKARSE